MLRVNSQVCIPLDEIETSAVRSQGPGGQNVNKVASAIHLRFDIKASSLPDAIKQRLLKKSDQRITGEGVIIIKAQNHRSLEKNRADALARLAELVGEASHTPRKRIPTRPGRAAKEKRLDAKKQRGSLKKLRGKPPTS
jgi:ribosome-associated protein